jgi:DNA-binding response OmpR family regulator
MTGKILIADDEAHIRLLIAQSLEDLEDRGVEIVTAANGAEAMEIIRDEKPDLVFLDIMMPEMSGFDVCYAAKHTLGLTGTFIVILTAKGQTVDREQGEQVGADLFLTKPFDPDQLLAIAGHVMDR